LAKFVDALRRRKVRFKGFHLAGGAAQGSCRIHDPGLIRDHQDVKTVVDTLPGQFKPNARRCAGHHRKLSAIHHDIFPSVCR
jgi:hypothetical protein